MQFQWAISNPKRWCCESAELNMLANLENSALAIGLERVSFHSNPKKGQCQRMFKLPHNCTHENMLSKWFSKSFKLGFNSMWAENFQTIQAGFRKGEEPEIKVPTTTGSQKKQGNFRKTSTSASLTTPKPFLCRPQHTVENLKDMVIPDHLTCLLRNVYAD